MFFNARKFIIFVVIFSIVFGALTASITKGYSGTDTVNPPLGYLPVNVNQQYLLMPAQAYVLLLQGVLPWGYNTNAEVLSSLGYTYEIANMSSVSGIDLSKYAFILIASDQQQSFYDAYAANSTLFDDYVKNGGVLVVFDCWAGWNGGTFNAPLPGGVTTALDYESNNLIVDSNHPIVTDELTEGTPITNADLVGNWCSHTIFDNLDALVASGSIKSLNVIWKTANSGKPTLIEYKVGNGIVIASGNTWEIAYEWNWAFATKGLDDVFAYAFNLSKKHIKASAGPGGTISPSGAASVNYGADQAFTITPDMGYMIGGIFVDGSSIRIYNPMGETYTFSNVTSDHTISASFVEIHKPTTIFNVKASVSVYGGYALVTPAEQSIQGGSPASILINPDAGYYITGLTDNGKAVALSAITDNGNGTFTYLIPSVYEDHNILVTLEKYKYTIDAEAGQGGIINPTGNVSVNYGDNQTFAITSDEGYMINQIVVDGNPLNSTDNTYVFNNVTGNHTISVTFGKIPVANSIMITLQIDNPYITVNGVSTKIDPQGSKPMIKEDRTLVPIRTIIESLGGTVEWDASERKVTINLNGHSIIFFIGKTTALVDGNKTTLDVAPLIIKGRTYIPLRFTSESLNANVSWYEQTKTVTIYYWP